MVEDDANLVRSILAGNQNDYCILVNRHQAAATQWALHYVRDSSRAEEIVQEAFVEAYFNLDRLRQPEKFRSWLRSFVKYAAIAWLRRRRSTLLVEEINSFARGYERYDRYETPTPHDELEQQEQDALLHVAIGAISPVHRQVITMFYFDGYSHQQIANQMNRSVSAVKSMLHRARQQLRKEIS